MRLRNDPVVKCCAGIQRETRLPPGDALAARLDVQPHSDPWARPGAPLPGAAQTPNFPSEIQRTTGDLEHRMLRLWGIWLIASFIVGVVIGLKGRERLGALIGMGCGLAALAFNLIEGDSFVSSFWSMAAAGGGLVAGALVGAGVARVLARF